MRDGRKVKDINHATATHFGDLEILKLSKYMLWVSGWCRFTPSSVQRGLTMLSSRILFFILQLSFLSWNLLVVSIQILTDSVMLLSYWGPQGWSSATECAKQTAKQLVTKCKRCSTFFWTAALNMLFKAVCRPWVDRCWHFPASKNGINYTSLLGFSENILWGKAAGLAILERGACHLLPEQIFTIFKDLLSQRPCFPLPSHSLFALVFYIGRDT